MARDIAAAFKAIERQAYRAGIDAMHKVAEEATSKVKSEVALNCLRRYYAYYKPERYVRTKSLVKSIKGLKPRTEQSGSTYSLILGIVFYAPALKGVYQSNSWYHQSGGKWISSNNLTGSNRGFNWNSQNNGIVDPKWVLDNFLLGRHPVMYGFKQDPTNTHEIMTEFFQDDMAGLLSDLVAIEFPKAVKKFLGIR